MIRDLAIIAENFDLQKEKIVGWPGVEPFTYFNRYHHLPQPYWMIQGHIGMRHWDIGTHLPIRIYRYDEVAAHWNGPPGLFSQKEKLWVTFPKEKLQTYTIDIRTPYCDGEARWTGDRDHSHDSKNRIQFPNGMSVVLGPNPRQNSYWEETLELKKPSRDGITYHEDRHGRKMMDMTRLCKEAELASVVNYIFTLGYPDLAKWLTG